MHSGVLEVPASELEVLNALIQRCSTTIQKNQSIVDFHGIRTAKLSARIGRRLNFPEAEVLKLIEGGLVHDVGKSMNLCKRWMKRYEGKTGTDVPVEEISYFRQLHTQLGPAVLAKADLSEAHSSLEFLSHVCRHHHDPEYSMTGPFRDLLAIVQVADSFDSMTSGEGYHSYAGYPPAHAIQSMRQLSGPEHRYYSSDIVDVLATLLS